MYCKGYVITYYILLIQSYISMRKNLVNVIMKDLITTYGKPCKPASSDTISRWIKDKLGMAGTKVNFC